MPKFRVHYHYTVVEYDWIDVEAEDEEDAFDRAYDEIFEDDFEVEYADKIED